MEKHLHTDTCGCGHDHGDHSNHTRDEHSHDTCSCGHDHSHEHAEDPHPDTNGNKITYIIENLGCANCAAKMEGKIKNLTGVLDANITFATKQLQVCTAEGEIALSTLQDICANIESEVIVKKKERIKKALPSPDTTKQDSSYIKIEKDLIPILSGAVLLAAGIVVKNTSYPLSVLLFLVGYMILGGRIVLTAGKNLLKGQIFDENFLMSIATLGALFIGEYPEAVGVMLFYRVGEWFEHKAVEKSRSQIMDAVDMRPEVVNLIQENTTQTVPAEDVQTGDLLFIRPGDRVPLDGIVVEGESRIDTSPITGEHVPVHAGAGDAVTSGCVNTSGALTIRVEKILEESMVSKILESVENAASSKPKIDRFITRFARVYTPIVVGVALLTAIVPSLFTGDWNYWIYTALTFLVISCPCALVLSVPLAFFSGIGAGSKKGILFKGGVSLEALKDIKAVVMDKTGTITKGDFSVQKIVTADTLNEEEILSLAAGSETASTHPIGVSIRNEADKRGITYDKPGDIKEIAGKGIQAEFPAGTVLAGNQSLLDSYHVSFDNYTPEKSGTEVYIALNQKLVGVILIADTLKDNARKAIDSLKKQNLKTVMLTGDSQASADAVAKQIGIDQVHAKLLPDQKLERLQDIRQTTGATLFVGDGINDAPVLAGADVGAAMGSGADAAIEAADVVFMTSSVEAIPESISIAKLTGKIAVQNVVFALVVKILVMILGLTGYASMWMAVFADTGVSILCILNSIRILYIRANK